MPPRSQNPSSAGRRSNRRAAYEEKKHAPLRAAPWLRLHCCHWILEMVSAAQRPEIRGNRAACLAEKRPAGGLVRRLSAGATGPHQRRPRLGKKSFCPAPEMVDGNCGRRCFNSAGGGASASRRNQPSPSKRLAWRLLPPELDYYPPARKAGILQTCEAMPASIVGVTRSVFTPRQRPSRAMVCCRLRIRTACRSAVVERLARSWHELPAVVRCTERQHQDAVRAVIAHLAV